LPTERILVGGEEVETLAERLRPGLRAIIVGINPSPVSVLAGHYYQGRLGKLLWKRLAAHGIVQDLEPGKEDEAAFEQGFGFADLIRRPTATSAELSRAEIAAAVPGLVKRLRPYRSDDPLSSCTFSKRLSKLPRHIFTQKASEPSDCLDHIWIRRKSMPS
jgi:G:T/U-mismatch repair DNA glycosylase